MKKKKHFLFEFIFIGVLIILVILSFVTFMKENSKRIIEQNNSFIEAATDQSVARMNDLIRISQENVKMLAHQYSIVLQKPEIDSETLRDMTERSAFDYVEFINSSGQDLTMDGRTADLSDREYFQRGIRGISGKCVIYNSKITNETLLIFYTPFYHKNKIIGVLSGIIRGNSLYDYMGSRYFGIQGSSYLLEKNGDVIFYSGEGKGPDNFLENLRREDKMDDGELNKLERALRENTAVNFNYRGMNGAGSAHVSPLTGGDWFMVQSFPSSLTRDMTEEADSAGIRLEVKLLSLCLIYIIYVFVKNRIQKTELIYENEEVSRIADAVPQLFSRFALVNLEDNTYEYLDGKRNDAPLKGAYTDLIIHLEDRYLDEDDGSREKMSVRITKEYVQEHLTKDVPYLQFEYQIDTDGRHWENMSILCLQRKGNVPVQVLFAIQDVTLIKEREREIRDALKGAFDAAEAANRAKSDFLARMSHDIRTPMNAIMGMTAIAAMHMEDKERLSNCLNKITMSSRHLLALINDVLDMSKIESGKVTLTEEFFSMAEMVEGIIEIIRPQANSKQQKLRVHIADIQHEDVIGDTLRIRQVFLNILGNAVKFTPAGGDVTFSIRECTSHIHGMACFEFICEDTGIGMDQEFIKTIFEPFARSQEADGQNIEGTGLGMSITHNIVRMMDGDIQVESEEGRGSRFTVRIYLKYQDREMDDIDALRDLRVLIADDDEDSCLSTSDILESIGMTPKWVLNGEDAVEATVEAHESDRDFSVVILDWKMPGKDGIQTAEEIRSRIGEDVPIIILSAYDWSEAETRAREAGVQAFVQKPLFRSRLVYALKSVLSQDSDGQKLNVMELEENNKYEGKRVLLVEDNEINREIAVELLDVIGINVEQAENGQIALDMVQEHPVGYYDLIFMDIQMPVMNGYEAARRIRSMDREDAGQLPIVAMTANAFASDIHEAMDAGMNDHVAKPVEVDKLLEMLDKWLRQ